MRSALVPAAGLVAAPAAFAAAAPVANARAEAGVLLQTFPYSAVQLTASR